MKTTCLSWLACISLTVSLWSSAYVTAADPYKTNPAPARDAVPKPAEVEALTVHPAKIALKGSDDACQLIVTASLAGSRLQDLTSDASYEPADNKVVRVSTAGRVIPLADGSTTITVRFGDNTVRVPVTAEKVAENLPVHFGNQIVPIFTKLGCNTGGCHGKSGGQNGFRLSLFGFDPELDYNALVKEARGRRLFPAAPEGSLLLLKAAGQMGHGGGKRFDVDSDDYRLIRRWIASGTPFGLPTAPKVTKIAVFPQQRILTRHNRQQLAVYAHFSDGSVEDVTRRAQYESNTPEVAVVAGSGLVYTLEMNGEAAVMVRYQGQATVFRATVQRDGPVPEYKFEPKTLVDRFTRLKWQQVGLVPAADSTDEEFCRRVYVDISGTLPTPAQVQAFLADPGADKRDRLVDDLLERPEYSYYFANKWATILRIKSANYEGAVDQNRLPLLFAFHSWIRDSIAADKPYDAFVREIVGAVGDAVKHPPVQWILRVERLDIAMPVQELVDETAQLFLGLRLTCAQCHHHPYEKWSQDDYWGLAAFFGRIGRKAVPVPGSATPRLTIYNVLPGTVASNQTTNKAAMPVAVIDKRTGKPAVMKFLDGAPVELGPAENPRHRLVDWMVDANNPFFARAIVNRYWAHFCGRGIAEPMDDMRATNPPTNPELLDALAKDLLEHQYSLKHLIRTICKSRTYQLSSVPNEFNKHDKQNFARYYARRLQAEVLVDAVGQVTNSPTVFQTTSRGTRVVPFPLPQDTYAPKRAIMLFHEAYASYFLEVFGQPKRTSVCECERSNEATLAQALHLLNSEEVQGKVTRAGGRADLLTRDSRPDAAKVEELFLWAYARKPTADELKEALRIIVQAGQDKKTAYEDLLWALINTKEFIFNK